jgi:hypothetical protein
VATALAFFAVLIPRDEPAVRAELSDIGGLLRLLASD